MKRIAALLGIVVLGLYGLVFIFDLRLNLYSDSIPLGIYQKVKNEPRKGMLGASCLDYEIAKFGLERGYLMKGNCPTGIQPVVKLIVAMAGDLVEVKDDLISVNGKDIDGSRIRDLDSRGRKLSGLSKSFFVVKEGDFLLMSSYRANSWDSRYWGAVGIEYVLKPLIIIKTRANYR